MVRSIHKTNIFAAFAFAVLATMGTSISLINNTAHASDVTFNVSVTEMLTVELSTPTTWAEGDLNTLLINKVNVAAKTNNTVGALVSMYANDTMLKNKANYSSSVPSTYIDSITDSVAVANFGPDTWGYSEDNATYNAIPTSANPAALFASVGAGTRTAQDVYFGAMSSGAKDSGTYAQTVNFVAVTGTVDTSETPVVPSPSDTSTDVIANNTPSYNSTSNQTSYTTRSTTNVGGGISSTTGEQKTTSTQVTSGDTTSSYASAAGVTTTTAGTNGASVATALAVAATVAAISGTIFFVAAKKRREDDEEEEE